MAGDAFTIDDWRISDAVHRKGRAKRAIYALTRPLLAANARRYLSRGFRADTRPDAVFFGRGTPLEWRRRWGAARIDIAGSTLLVQGTGTGWDVVSWAELRPKRIVATDLFPFEESWDQIDRHCRDVLGVRVDFRTAPLEDHGFLAAGSVDLCASDAVFEHCRDLPAVLAETRRVLRPGGTVYATYGPLWFAPGGDHFSGRGGLAHAYSHVALPESDYRRYFDSHRTGAEGFQSGGRYVELDLFSKLTTRQYLAAYTAAGFARDGLIIELAPEALEFRRKYPDAFAAVLERNRERCTADDLLVKANFVRLTKAV